MHGSPVQHLDMLSQSQKYFPSGSREGLSHMCREVGRGEEDRVGR